jgi:hypothetical protein
MVTREPSAGAQEPSSDPIFTAALD